MYKINEIFYSLQGEGANAGRSAVFVRFAGCNLHCTRATQGFECDTDHLTFTTLELAELSDAVTEHDVGGCQRVVLTGGEPLLQVDRGLTDNLHDAGYSVWLETNGTMQLGYGAKNMFDYIACSPKRGVDVRVNCHIDECRVILPFGVDPPDQIPVKADAYFLSPASKNGSIDRACVQWCVTKCLENPLWALSMQRHKMWNVK